MASAENIVAAAPARGALSETDSRAVLSAAGIPMAKGGLAGNADAAAAIAQEIGYPVALKVDSADIPHKSEAGGIALAVASEADLRHAFDEVLATVAARMPQAIIAGVGVYEMVGEAVEMIVGMRRDAIFGPVLLLGMGGVFAEILDDKILRVAPLCEGESAAMARDLKGFPVLDGARGRPPADIAALADILERLAALALAVPEIEEIDINPLMLLPRGQGARAADALVVLRRPQS